MGQSLSIPHFLFADEVNLDAISLLRHSLNQESSITSIGKMSYMPFFIKAMSLALQEYPIVNSRLHIEDDKPSIVLRPQHNIGIAMDTPDGLFVPNIKNVQDLSLDEINLELKRLKRDGSNSKLSHEDLTGGTITISNIGNIGGTYVAPVIVTSEVAILGIGRARKVPTFDDNDQVVPATIVNFSWSADHRLIDGATMAKMASLLKRYIETPALFTAKLR